MMEGSRPPLSTQDITVLVTAGERRDLVQTVAQISTAPPETKFSMGTSHLESYARSSNLPPYSGPTGIKKRPHTGKCTAGHDAVKSTVTPPAAPPYPVPHIRHHLGGSVGIVAIISRATRALSPPVANGVSPPLRIPDAKKYHKKIRIAAVTASTRKSSTVVPPAHADGLYLAGAKNPAAPSPGGGPGEHLAGHPRPTNVPTVAHSTHLSTKTVPDLNDKLVTGRSPVATPRPLAGKDIA